jgi:hypothetical protein
MEDMDDKKQIIEGSRAGQWFKNTANNAKNFAKNNLSANGIRNNLNKVGNFAKNSWNKTAEFARKNLDPCKPFQNQISDLDRSIAVKDATINQLNGEISGLENYLNNCINTNNKIIYKNNSLLDTSQYFKDLLFGTNKSDGYIKSVLNANTTNDKIKNQPISGYVKEGYTTRYAGVCGKFIRRIDDRNTQISERNNKIAYLKYKISILNEYKKTCDSSNNVLMTKNSALLDISQFFEQQANQYDQMLINMYVDKTNLLDKKMSDNINREGFDSGYNKVTNENAIIQNQININQEQHSIDNKLYSDLDNRIQFLNNLNQILSVCLFVLIIVSGIVIWISDKSLTHKLVMIKVVWLYVIIVEIIEYVLFYVVRYLRALFYGQPYDINGFWKFPELTWMDIGILILIVLSVFI